MLLGAREVMRRHQPPTDTIYKVFGNQIEALAKEFDDPVRKKWTNAVPVTLLIPQARTCIICSTTVHLFLMLFSFSFFFDVIRYTVFV